MQHILSLSYGKDSLACLGAIEQLGLPLDRIVHAEVWATDTIPADLPPMVEFKKKADKIIKERYGIEVEHICALKTQGRVEANKHTKECSITDCKKESLQELSKDFHKQSAVGAKSSSLKQTVLTYEDMFYRHNQKKKQIQGFPISINRGNWCTRLKQLNRSQIVQVEREREQVIQYLGIASDEPKRIERHSQRSGIILPLVEIGWTEEICRKWCEDNDLLSPIYTTATRGGCWFCHNQGIEQLRLLRKNYPDLWQLLLKWDSDSPVTFKADGDTVHDFDKRFRLEDEMLIVPDAPFRWKMLDEPLQMRFF
jgi:hypothetical protein